MKNLYHNCSVPATVFNSSDEKNPDFSPLVKNFKLIVSGTIFSDISFLNSLKNHNLQFLKKP